MKKYEGMFIVDTEVASKKWEEVDTLIRNVVKKHEGETLDLAVWEERKLAYPIRKRRKGTYLLGHFQVPPENLNNIRDEFKITETILRQIFVIDDGKRAVLEHDEEDEGNNRKRRPARREEGGAPKDAKPEASTEEAKTEGVAEETKTEVVAEEAKTEGVAEEAKTEVVAEDAKTEVVAEDAPVEKKDGEETPVAE